MSVRLLDELNDLEKLSLIPVSYSRFNTLGMCEAKYYYSYIEKEEGVFGEAAVLGNILHSVLENKIEKDTPVQKEDYKVFIQEYETQILEYDPNHNISKELIGAGTSMIGEFIDRHEGQSFPVHEKEMGFEIVIGSGLFRGFIDRIDVEGNQIHVVDYKSGKREVADKHIAKDLQLGLYALAVDHLFPGKEISAELYYLRSGKQKGHLFTRNDLLEVESKLLDQVRDLVYKLSFRTSPQAWPCSFCDYAETGSCSAGVKRRSR